MHEQRISSVERTGRSWYAGKCFRCLLKAAVAVLGDTTTPWIGVDFCGLLELSCVEKRSTALL
jgi:hypothetical protein